MENEPQPKNPDEEKARDLLAAWHEYRDFIDSQVASVEQMEVKKFHLPYVINQSGPYIRELPDVDTAPNLVIDIEKLLEVEHTIERHEETGDIEILTIKVISTDKSDKEKVTREMLDRCQVAFDDSNGEIVDLRKGYSDIDFFQELINGAKDYAEFVELKK